MGVRFPPPALSQSPVANTLLPLGGRRLLVLNDNNFPFSNGRNAAKADPNEAIVIRVPGLLRE